MDVLVDKKKHILKEIKRKLEDKSLTQTELVDLRQEFERSNHLMTHMIRGAENPAGRYAAGLLFLLFGMAYAFNTPKILSRVFVNRLPVLLISPLIGYKLGALKYSNSKEARRMRSYYNNSWTIDEELYEIIDKIKHDNFHLADKYSSIRRMNL
jgi:hypothetical protein